MAGPAPDDGNRLSTAANVSSPRSKADLSDLSVVVLSHNRIDVIERNLHSLVALSLETGCELIVVDNASTDGSTELVRNLLSGMPSMELIVNAANMGAAGGRNIGWLRASRRYILSIDDDAFISHGAAVELQQFLSDNPDIGIVSPQIRHASTGEIQFKFKQDGYLPAGHHEACHLIRRSVIDAAGLYDENCSFGGEGLDLSIRVRAAGYEVAYLGDVVAHHASLTRSGSEGRRRRELWVYGFVRLFHKHFPGRVAGLFSFRFLASHLVSGVRSFGPGFALSLFREALRGRRDGLRLYRPIPDAVVRFYSQPDLLPDFGNVPITHKLAARVRRLFMRHGS